MYGYEMEELLSMVSALKGPGGEIPKFGAQLGGLASLSVDAIKGIKKRE